MNRSPFILVSLKTLKPRTTIQLSLFVAPSEAPSNVHVTAGGPGELHVSWRPPPREAWHGELLGYSVTCIELGLPEPQPRNASR